MKSAGVKYMGNRGLETAHVLVVDHADSPLVQKLDEISSERKKLNEELKEILLNRSERYPEPV